MGISEIEIENGFERGIWVELPAQMAAGREGLPLTETNAPCAQGCCTIHAHHGCKPLISNGVLRIDKQ